MTQRFKAVEFGMGGPGGEDATYMVCDVDLDVRRLMTGQISDEELDRLHVATCGSMEWATRIAEALNKAGLS